MVSFHHVDLYSQVLAKLERGHARDLDDVKAMAESGLIDPQRVVAYFDEIEPEVYRFPAIDPPSFRKRVEGFIDAMRDSDVKKEKDGETD